MNEKLINIAIPNTGRKLYTYSCGKDLPEDLIPGQRVVVPFGRKNLIGYFIEKTDKIPDVKTRGIRQIIDHVPIFDKKLYKFLLWMADYYYSGLGDTLNASNPPWLRRLKHPLYIISGNLKDLPDKSFLPEYLLKKMEKNQQLVARDIKFIRQNHPGLIERLLGDGLISETWTPDDISISKVRIGFKLTDTKNPDEEFRKKLQTVGLDKKVFQKADLTLLGITDYKFRKLIKENQIEPVYGQPDIFGYFKSREGAANLTPNKEQTEAINEITAELNAFLPWLLYGITGSGKTLVYCKVASEVIKNGRSVLVLVPEIALAGTLLSYFKSFFGEDIALLHSALKPKERLLVWQNIRSGKYKIVIGARSAIFAPLENIGLIIVDEEHDESYKQDDPAPRFQARDAAVMRAKISGIPVILGSATPSLESYYNALNSRYKLLKLTRRPEKTKLPVTHLIDLKEERPSRDNPFFSPTMISKIKYSLQRKHQVILYLNRRGFSPRIRCGQCGHTPVCPHCQISLTYHKVGNKLMCHFCGYSDRTYHACAVCKSDRLDYIGAGTQKVEEIIGELFADAKITRLDSDSAAGRDRAHLILSEFASKKYNLLLGTQMVTKGIDFPDVSLVGVLNADIGLDMPDFRAPEKLFAKLIQVSGRSGRGIVPGEVAIQTYNPNLDLIDDAARQDYDTFYEREIKSRQSLSYPPFSHLINFRFASKNENDVVKQSLLLRQALDMRLKDSKIRAIMLGPAPCPLYRLRGMYRRHLFAKTGQVTTFIHLLYDWEQKEPGFGLPSNVKLIIDVDPYDMM